MGLGIGIDTGGTYTDAVVYDFERRGVLAKGKARTTKEDLALGICAAIDTLPPDLTHQASMVALSTTLATNACVEGKGGRAKVVLVGTNENVLRRIGANEKHGFSIDDALCIDQCGAYDGSTVSMPDWDDFMQQNAEVLGQAQAFGIAEVYAERNGAVVEHAGAEALSKRFGVPVVMASSLVNGLNMMERGATAVLNARLLPVIEEFLDASIRALHDRGIEAPVMIVRSDSSLMGEAFARTAPVETMVSGPAASVQGCRELVNAADALVVDMGGTTSDISLIEGGDPAMTNGIRIGSWSTQVHGVLIDTIGLGGDSAVVFESGGLGLAETRVEPLCMAASRWPHLVERLQALIDEEAHVARPLYEVLYLVGDVASNVEYTDDERRLVELLKKGPLVIGDQEEFEYFKLERGRMAARLESEGIVMRCGLTPTDIMHIQGDFSAFDARASMLAVRYLCSIMPMFGDTEEGRQALCETVYDLVKRKLYVNIARVLIENSHPSQFSGGLPQSLEGALAEEWGSYVDRKRAGGAPRPALRPALTLRAPLVGLGAPIHVFLPDVAEALGTCSIVPENAEVANAVGAIVASVVARVTVRVLADWTAAGIEGYIVHADEQRVEYGTREEAESVAAELASEAAQRLARERGASGPLRVRIETEVTERLAEGIHLYQGTGVTAIAFPA